MKTLKHNNVTYQPCVIIDAAQETTMPRWLSQRLRGFAEVAFDRRCAPALPELQLLYAVIERAWFDLTLTEPQYRREAVKWFISGSDEPWSFTWVCDHLHLTSSFRNRVIREVEEIRA